MNTIQTTEVFDKWFDELKDRTAKARIQARIDRAEDGNFGNCSPVGEGVSEMRIHVGAGYRVYYKQAGMEIYLLLAGGDKSTQQRDIETALGLARNIKESGVSRFLYEPMIQLSGILDYRDFFLSDKIVLISTLLTVG